MLGRSVKKNLRTVKKYPKTLDSMNALFKNCFSLILILVDVNYF